MVGVHGVPGVWMVPILCLDLPAVSGANDAQNSAELVDSENESQEGAAGQWWGLHAPRASHFPGFCCQTSFLVDL